MTPFGYIVVGALLACTGGGATNVVNVAPDTAEDLDETGPVIEHDPIETSQTYAEPVAIEATIYDEQSSVFVVEVSYKQETSTSWDSIRLEAGEGDLYTGEIPAEDVGSGGMDYYLYAMDTEENETLEPEEGESDPYHFRVSAR